MTLHCKCKTSLTSTSLTNINLALTRYSIPNTSTSFTHNPHKYGRRLLQKTKERIMVLCGWSCWKGFMAQYMSNESETKTRKHGSTVSFRIDMSRPSRIYPATAPSGYISGTIASLSEKAAAPPKRRLMWTQFLQRQVTFAMRTKICSDQPSS